MWEIPLQPIQWSIPGTIIDFEIDDYYSHFFGTSVKDIENNSPEDAFKYGTFILNTLNYKNGYHQL